MNRNRNDSLQEIACTHIHS